MIELKMYDKENTRARVQRNSILVCLTDGYGPPVRQPIHIRRHGLQKRPSQTNFVLQQGRISLCWVKKKIATQQAHQSDLKSKGKKFIY